MHRRCKSDLPSADWCAAYLIGWARDATHAAAIRDVLVGIPVSTVSHATGVCERTLRRWAMDARSDLHRAWIEHHRHGLNSGEYTLIGPDR